MAKKYFNLGQTLKKLLFEKGIKAADLSREINIPPPTLHRLITGKSTRPYKSSLQPIADYFSISIDELIGEKTAEGISKDKALHPKSKAIIHQLPLIIWNNLSHFPNFQIDKNVTESIPFAGMMSGEGFATILNDSSMEPLFPRGSLLLFDPEKPYKDRSYILIQLNESPLFVFRQLIIDLDQKYLKPLNPDLNTFKMRLLTEKDKIIATLIEARQLYNEN